ncbi:MAG: hypothetical protein PHR81_08225 [Bacteroidales bacterium]|jgi:adenosine deaminase|nr:hypothetical protein [Bacteroidales bacterium]MDD4214780.1 hypothetical protein [Bacteroidales bacterium]
MFIKEFETALEKADIALLAKIPKSDLHNHAELGSRLELFEEWCGKKISTPPEKMPCFSDFEKYLSETFNKFLSRRKFFRYTKKASFTQAVNDGICVLQMSIDSRAVLIYGFSGKKITEITKRNHQQIAPEICFIPQLGLDRRHHKKLLLYEAEILLNTGYFKSIDLYGDETYGDIKDFIPLYRKAKKMGLKLTAHAGEYGTADSVKKAVELLELQQVQHGISAAASPEVMKWLADNNIILNVCPTSNVVLCRVKSIKEHPIRKLFDYGVRVTINTDDLMIFNQSVSQEYLNLFNAKVFNARELDIIRQTGLKAFND